MNVPEIPQDGAFNVIFAGNIGLAQGLDILPKAAVLLKNNSKRYRFNIVGDGRYKSIFINTVYQYNVSDMFNFIEKQPAKRIPELIAVCDGALISLSRSQVFSMTIPAKTQSCLACGIPIIVSADGEIQEIVREAGAGVCSNSGDAEMLADKIIELSSNPKEVLNQMSYNAVKYYREHFDKKMLLDKIDYYFI